MQITIVQAEIEEAIRRYVGSQLKVADGMEMSIDLSATRGAEGFKATIDITPIGEEKAKATVTAPALTVPKPAIFKTPTVSVPAAPAPEPEQASTEKTEEAAPFATEETSAQAGEEAQASETSTEELQHKEVRDPAEGNGEGKTGTLSPTSGGGGRSLFKGLTKPKNN